jgi:hypothetical protein
MQIPIYIICEGDPKSNYVAKLVSLFQDNCFDIFIIDCIEPVSKGKGNVEQGSKHKQYLYSLNHAKENYCESPCVLIKDCMFSNLSSNTMSNLIHKIVEGCGYSICYLARYLDLCDGSIVESGITTGGSIVTTKYAKGDDGILYTKDARDTMILKLETTKKRPTDILSNLIKDSKYPAVAISPPALQYNPSFGDMQKTWECKSKGGPQPPQPCPTSSTGSWMWYVLIFFIILILVLGFCFWR